MITLKIKPMNPGAKKAKEVIVPEREDKSIQFGLFKQLVEERKYTEGDLKDRVSVDELIDEMYKRGCRPVISVKEKRLDEAMQTGLTPYRTWDKGYRMNMKKRQIYETKTEERLRGTFGREPYIPKGEKRGLLFLDVPRERIAPVYTGPNANFNGIVQISGKIVKPEFLEKIEFEEPESELVSKTRKKTTETISRQPRA